MKKLTTIFGVLSALTIVAGVIHKTYHLPGAFYLLMLGMGIFLMIYLVLLCINKIRESRGIERVMHIVKYISYMFLALGTWFLIERFPGALFMMDIGFGLFIFGFLSLKYMVQRSKHPEGGALNKVLPSVILAVLVFGIANRNMSGRIFESMAYSDMQVRTMIAASDTTLHYVMLDFEHNATQFPAQMNAKYNKAVGIVKRCDEFAAYLEQCKQQVTKLSCKEENTDTLSLDKLSGRNNSNEPNRYFMGTDADGQDGEAFEIRRKIDLFKNFIETEAESKNKIIFPIELSAYKWKSTGEAVPWEIALFKDQMLISDLAYLDLLILSVRQTEKDVIASLLSDARAEVMWTFWKKYKELTPGQNTK